MFYGYLNNKGHDCELVHDFDLGEFPSNIYIVASHLRRGSVVTVAVGQINGGRSDCGPPTMQGASNLRGGSAQDFILLQPARYNYIRRILPLNSDRLTLYHNY